MVKKLREYDKEKDEAISIGRKGLYKWNGEDYASVEVLAMLNKRERPILTVYNGKEEAEVALFNESGDGLFVLDETLEFKENDFITVGFKDTDCDGHWMEWILAVDRIAGAYPDPYEIINGKIDMIIAGSDVVGGVISTGCTSSSQQWIRKAKKSEIDLLVSTVIRSGNEEQISIIKKVMDEINKPKYEFKPFDRVLVRDADDETWAAGIYSYYVNGKGCRKKHGVCGNDYGYEQCIPYEGNEDLWMTTNKPKEK